MKVTTGIALPKTSTKYTLVIPVGEGVDKIALGTLLSSFEISGVTEILETVQEKIGELHTLYSNSSAINGILLAGMGNGEVVSKAKSVFISAGAKFKKFISENVAIDISLLHLDNISAALFIEQSTCGLFVGTAGSANFKTEEKEEASISSLHIFTSDAAIKENVLRGKAKGETVSSIIELVNAPSNHKTTEHLASWLKTSAHRNDFRLRVLEKEELKKEGFHALLAVNRGSEVPAKCLIASYRPSSEDNLPKVTIVGKGVTFDTGGLSIKGRNNMHYMKSDMGGAAAAMGTIELAAKLNIPVDLTVIIPTTDNSVDALSIKPGDVISSYSGRTIEVIDTDAEGRLILADALSYAVKNNPPDYLVDLATLTGSVVAALGTEAAGIMSHNDDLVLQLSNAGDRVGEKIWRLPLWKEYATYMESDIADIRNLGTKPMAGAITAAKFLESFVDDHSAWAHLDIAGTAFGNFPTTKGYSATGFGIDLLTNWLLSLTHH